MSANHAEAMQTTIEGLRRHIRRLEAERDEWKSHAERRLREMDKAHAHFVHVGRTQVRNFLRQHNYRAALRAFDDAYGIKVQHANEGK